MQILQTQQYEALKKKLFKRKSNKIVNNLCDNIIQKVFVTLLDMSTRALNFNFKQLNFNQTKIYHNCFPLVFVIAHFLCCI